MEPVAFNYRQVIAAGVVLGVVCAAVVWWLERFELQKVRQEIRDTIAGEAAEYLKHWAEYREWRLDRGLDAD